MEQLKEKVSKLIRNENFLFCTGATAIGVFMGVSLYFIFREPRVIVVRKKSNRLNRSLSMEARDKMTKEEILRIQEFVKSNFNPLIDEIHGLKLRFEKEAKHSLINLQDRSFFKRERVLEIVKFMTMDMMSFEQDQILESRIRRRALLNSKKTMSYVDECLRSYADEYGDVFEAKLLRFLRKMGLDDEEIELMKVQNDFGELLQDPEVEDLRKLVEAKCMLPSRIIRDSRELEKLLRYLVAVYYTYSVQPEMAHFTSLIPLCCEDEMFKKFQVNGEDISASIYEYALGTDSRLYIYIKDYLEVFVGYQSQSETMIL